MEGKQSGMNYLKIKIKSFMNVIQLENCNYKTQYEHIMEFVIEHF